MSTAFELTNQARGRSVLSALKTRFRTARGERSRGRETCFDTFDWRLWKAGATLTGHREGRRWSMRWRAPGRGVEIRETTTSPPAFAWDVSPGRLRRELDKVVEMRRLLPLVELERSSGEKRHVGVHIHYHLLADIFSGLGKSVAGCKDLSEPKREALREAAAEMLKDLEKKPRRRK